MTNIAGSSAGPWRGATAALCALLVGIGLGRFAYTPLIPALAAAEWFTASDAAYLGAANLAGYLAGAALARMLAARTSTRYTLRGGMLLASVAFFACAQPFPFEWFFLWRFIAGMCGGILMVLAAPTVLPFVPANRQGLAGGVIMTGVALGIALSGTMVPLTLELGLTETWAALGILATLLTAIAWHGWPAAPNGGETAVKTSPPPGLRVLKSLYIEYCLNAMGLVPHMVFWVVFIVRGLNQGLDVGAMYWVVFGVGAMLGPVSMGYLADRIGSLWALRLGYLLQAVFVGVVAVTDNTAVLIASSLVMGAFVPASTTLVLIRLRHVIGHDAGAQTGGWRLATIAFAFGQAAGGYGLSYLFDVGSDYRPLYAVGSAALVLSLVLNFAAGQSGKAARIDQV
ncbi:MAG: YbfB/YjiJ family MFS transporter [Alphaproteobacteria bacterium]|nr:YbfB/YjiJ family MFS transporter [Alphaproteobacteria bacterium]MDP6254000.1 YbfB/YjiJ family MFS transporter [Alphaproteobacteria bacterium]MDP7053076.1 YbfB/YjiJ family MFS transporter [Alphaproteobacteria bacterium]MDP7227597.1 YbfB/YjiJ family MFS transporter [Alphaproteobacteria bacterium]MDP7460356.1 YbfB/YjiJ family MFS transporter [Alphaproteobacteria bacterium]